MDRVKIKKGSIKTCVAKGAFEQLYKPQGWVLDEGQNQDGGINKELEDKGITKDSQALEYIKEKKARKKMNFNDNLFKGE